MVNVRWYHPRQPISGMARRSTLGGALNAAITVSPRDRAPYPGGSNSDKGHDHTFGLIPTVILIAPWYDPSRLARNSAKEDCARASSRQRCQSRPDGPGRACPSATN